MNWCWLGIHKWTAWSVPAIYSVYTLFGWGEGKFQDRSCTRCGKFQERRIG